MYEFLCKEVDNLAKAGCSRYEILRYMQNYIKGCMLAHVQMWISVIRKSTGKKDFNAYDFLREMDVPEALFDDLINFATTHSKENTKQSDILDFIDEHLDILHTKTWDF